MKSILIITICILSESVFSQTLTEKIAREACTCFKSPGVKNKDKFMEEFISSCLNNSMLKFKDEIVQSMDTTQGYSAGYEFGKKSAPEIMGIMVLECDKFYAFFDSLRWSGRASADLTLIRQRVKAANEKIESGNHESMVYLDRGMAYFQLDEYSLAKIDLEEAIKIDSTLGGAYMFRGWIKEIDGDFLGAKEDYQKCLEITHQSAIMLFVNTAERKIRMASTVKEPHK